MHYDIDRLSRGFSNDTLNIQMYTKSLFDGEAERDKASRRLVEGQRKAKIGKEKQGEPKSCSR